MDQIILAKGVKRQNSGFDPEGGMLSFSVPSDCKSIILMGNRGGGYVPYEFLLPHQVYLSDIKDTFKDKNFEIICVLPTGSKEAFPLAYKNDYCRQRWEKSYELSKVHRHRKDNP